MSIRAEVENKTADFESAGKKVIPDNKSCGAMHPDAVLNSTLLRQRYLANSYLETVGGDLQFQELDFAQRMTEKDGVVKPIQPKLTINQPGDKYEQEADKIADWVMEAPDFAQHSQQQDDRRASWNQAISQKITPIDESEQDADQSLIVTPEHESRINALADGGQPLSRSTRAFFEPRFGYNFSKVRIHTAADTLNDALNARAFTIRQNIFFSRGDYDPMSSSGRQLLAHELTHVIQQANIGRGKFPFHRLGEPDRQLSAKAADPVKKRLVTQVQRRPKDEPSSAEKPSSKAKAPKPGPIDTQETTISRKTPSKMGDPADPEFVHWYTPWLIDVDLPFSSRGWLNVEEEVEPFDTGWRRDALGSALIPVAIDVLEFAIVRRLGLKDLRALAVAVGLDFPVGYAGLYAQERAWGKQYKCHIWYGRYRVNVVTGELLGVMFYGRGPSKILVGEWNLQQRIVDADGKPFYTHWVHKYGTPVPDASNNLPEHDTGVFVKEYWEEKGQECVSCLKGWLDVPGGSPNYEDIVKAEKDCGCALPDYSEVFPWARKE